MVFQLFMYFLKNLAHQEFEESTYDFFLVNMQFYVLTLMGIVLFSLTSVPYTICYPQYDNHFQEASVPPPPTHTHTMPSQSSKCENYTYNIIGTTM